MSGAGRSGATGAPMDFWTTLAGFADDLRGALAGGIMAALLDKGPLWQRLLNGGVASLFAVAVSRGIVEVAHLPPSGDVRAMIAAIMALLGVILADGAQRILRRLVSVVRERAGDVVDRIATRIVGGDSK